MTKNVLITGGAKGIGRAIAKEFASLGYNVYINYNHSEKDALNLAKAIGCTAIKANVANMAEVQKMFEQIAHVDILVNNAGVSYSGLLTDMSEGQWDALFDINVKGVFNCTKAALPYMINKKAGSIINISSIWGITGASCEVAYSASKAAVIGFTKALAKEVGPSNITVNCVAPGATDTDMLNNLTEADKAAIANDTPLCRIGTPEEIAKSVLFLAQSTYITGQVLSPNGGIVI